MDVNLKGQKVSIATWFLLIATILSVAVRFAVKYNISKKLGLDDVIVSMAVVSDIASSICVSKAAANGLGSPSIQTSDPEFQHEAKSLYASFFFYIATLHLAKLSILVFLRSLTPVKMHRKLIDGLGVLTVLLWIIEWITIALQCSHTQPWNLLSDTCIDKVALWRFIGVMNIVTDICLILTPFLIVGNLRLSFSKKVMVIGCFSSRVFDVAITSVQIATTPAFGVPDPYNSLWEWVLIAQLVQCVTIITSCIPYLKPLLESRPSGIYMSDELRRRDLSSIDYGRPSIVSSKNKSYVPREVPYQSDTISKKGERKNNIPQNALRNGSVHISTGTSSDHDNMVSASIIPEESVIMKTIVIASYTETVK